MKRIGKALALSAVAILVSSGLSACSARSIEAYCEVMSKHKERYVSAMNEASQANNPLIGLTGAIAALGDINTMWEEAAKVAPEEIETDIEAVRDVWAQQEETAQEMQSNPIRALASSLVSGVMNSGSLSRVDAYTEQNCPGIGAMFISTNADSQSTITGSPSDTSLTTSDEGPTSEPEPGFVIDDDSQPFGMYLKVKSSDGGSTLLYNPETDSATPLDEAGLFPDEEIESSEYFYSTRASDPYIVGVFGIRVPATGLEPETYWWKIAKLSVQEKLTVETVVKIEHGEFDFEQDSLSPDGIFLVGTIIGENNDNAVRAVDVNAGKVLWEREGEFIKFGSNSNAGLSASSGEACEEFWGSNYIESVELKSGKRQHAIGTTRDECLILDSSNSYGASLVGYEPSDVNDVPPPMVFDLDTGKTHKTSDRDRADGFFDVNPDPAQPLALAPHGEGWQVVNRETGKVGLKMTSAKIDSLSLKVESLFDGLLYVTTTDEQLVVDAMTGDELGHWSRYPTEKVGSHVWMSDHVLEDEGWIDPVAETR